MLQKAEKNDHADSEFSEGRRNAFVHPENNKFFVGSDAPDKRQYDTVA